MISTGARTITSCDESKECGDNRSSRLPYEMCLKCLQLTVCRTTLRSMNIFALFKDFFITLYEFREYLRQSVARDLRKKYKRSVLGYLWSMLNPLLMMSLLAVVFAKIMQRGTQDYAIFLFCALIAWYFFDGTVQQSLRSIRANAKLLENVPIPKFLFPAAIASYNIVNFFLMLVPLFIVMLVLGRPIPVTVIALPAVLIPLFCFTMGVSLMFAVAHVFFEDTQHLAGVLLRALYFLSPILYGREQLPEWLIKWVVLNPMFCILEFMRDIFYYGQFPNWQTYFLNLAGSLLFLACGLWLFKKTDDKFLYFL